MLGGPFTPSSCQLLTFPHTSYKLKTPSHCTVSLLFHLTLAWIRTCPKILRDNILPLLNITKGSSSVSLVEMVRTMFISLTSNMENSWSPAGLSIQAYCTEVIIPRWVSHDFSCFHSYLMDLPFPLLFAYAFQFLVISWFMALTVKANGWPNSGGLCKKAKSYWDQIYTLIQRKLFLKPGQYQKALFQNITTTFK